MALVGPGRSKLAELVPHHILGYIDRDMLASIVNCEGMANKIRENGGSAAPGLQDDLSPFSFIF